MVHVTVVVPVHSADFLKKWETLSGRFNVFAGTYKIRANEKGTLNEALLLLDSIITNQIPIHTY